MEPVEAIEFMTEKHFRNRHPECGELLGLLFTYYELIAEQHRREKERNHEDGVSKSGGGSTAEKRLEVDSSREGGGSLSHLVSEILWQYVMMPEVKIPQVKIPERLVKAEADKMVKAALADEMELKDHRSRPHR
jgi:hypothetical protein